MLMSHQTQPLPPTPLPSFLFLLPQLINQFHLPTLSLSSLSSLSLFLSPLISSVIMATIIRTPPSVAPPPRLSTVSSISSKFLCVSFGHRSFRPSRSISLRLSNKLHFQNFVPFAATEESAQTEVLQESSEIEDNSANVAGVEDDVEDGATDGDTIDAEEIPASPVIASLRSYKEALATNDESKVSEIEAFLKSIEDEKNDLAIKVATLSEELSTERTRVIRISADFDNFRKRTDRERLSLVSNAQGEVVENLLSVLDNFERAKAQIKVENEGEQKIINSYQSIYKQFTEILGSLGVVPVETIGKPFDPLLHEAIMREESAEFEEGIVLEEFRKGFQLGDRLLRPSMVKVSAGPGPAKPESVEQSEEAEDVTESGEEGSAGEESPVEKP